MISKLVNWIYNFASFFVCLIYLKELRNCIFTRFTGLCKSAFSTYLFGKLVVLTFCAFSVCFFCIELDVIFLNFYNICVIIVSIVCVRCFYSHLLEAICKKLTRHKNLITALNIKKNMPPGSFWVKKNLLIKKNVTIRKMKQCIRNAINTPSMKPTLTRWGGLSN